MKKPPSDDIQREIAALQSAHVSLRAEVALLLTRYQPRVVIGALLLLALQTARQHLDQDDFAQMVARTMILGGFAVSYAEADDEQPPCPDA